MTTDTEALFEKPVEARRARMDVRLTPSEKQLIAAAAAQEETAVSTFIRRTVLTRARAVVEQTRRIDLSATDFAMVMELLDQPPAPTPALNQAVVAKYGER